MLGARPTQDSLQRATYDVAVIGGGITGAGIALQAAQLGLSVILLEQKDYAWGTSSRSSKMVHGGLRYLAQGDFRLTRHSLQERERLLRELPELVARKTYLFPIQKGKFPGRWAMKMVLWLYDTLAGIRDHHWLSLSNLRQRLPNLRLDSLTGAMSYTDAITDDCRLVLRLLHEAAEQGACLINYCQVDSIHRHDSHFTLDVNDTVADKAHAITAKKVINATGAFADRLSAAKPRVRPQRGSHLFFEAERFPVTDCLTLLHPEDRRPVFIFPWQGVTCVGTTDLDHKPSLDQEAAISQREVDYLLQVVNTYFPTLNVTAEHIVSSIAGVRPIVASGKGRDPSKERRDHAVWEEQGIISVSGGKLTTFRLIALDALQAAGLLDKANKKRLKTSREPLCRYNLPFEFGNPLKAVPTGDELDARLAWSLQHEQVEHLDDLLLRRVRLGNVRANAGEDVLPRIKPLCCDALGWDNARWQQEVSRYRAIQRQYYQPPACPQPADISLSPKHRVAP